MKKTFYLITITLLALTLSACEDTSEKILSCKHTLNDELNHKTITTKITTTFNHEENKALTMDYEIETSLAEENYDELEAKAYNEAHKADEVCSNVRKKLITQNDDFFKCDEEYDNHKIITTYSYDIEKLDIEDQEIILHESKTLPQLKTLFENLNYTCE